jgi:hypothetical protein
MEPNMQLEESYQFEKCYKQNNHATPTFKALDMLKSIFLCFTVRLAGKVHDTIGSRLIEVRSTRS